jgi:hypothetical protein
MSKNHLLYLKNTQLLTKKETMQLLISERPNTLLNWKKQDIVRTGYNKRHFVCSFWSQVKPNGNNSRNHNYYLI